MDRCSCGERAIVKVQMEKERVWKCLQCAKEVLNSSREDWPSKPKPVTGVVK